MISRKRATIATALILLLFILPFILGGLYPAIASKWPAVQGQVTGVREDHVSDFNYDDWKSNDVPTVIVAYKYIVNGKAYTGKTTITFENTHEDYYNNKTVDIYYFPLLPFVSVIEPLEAEVTIIIFVLCFPLAFIGTAIICMWLLGWKVRKANTDVNK